MKINSKPVRLKDIKYESIEVGEKIPFSRIKEHPKNPRLDSAFEGEKFKELKESISEELVNPILLLRIKKFFGSIAHDHNTLYIGDGHRRWRAINELHEEGIWKDDFLIVGETCLIKVVDYKKSLELIAQANCEGNEAFTIREQTKLIKEMLVQKISLRKIGKCFGKSDGWVRDRKNLLEKVHTEAEREPFYSGQRFLHELRANYIEPGSEPDEELSQLTDELESTLGVEYVSIEDTFEDVDSQIDALVANVQTLRDEGMINEDQQGHVENTVLLAQDKT